MVRTSLVCIFAAVTAISLAAFQWDPPSVVHGYFGRGDSRGYLLRGILHENRENIIPLTSDSVAVFQASCETVNGIFSGDLQLHEHPRGYRSVQLQLKEGHFTGVLDTHQGRWINPEILLPLKSSSSINVRAALVDSGLDDTPLPWVELEIGIPAAEAGRNGMRPVKSLKIWQESVRLLAVDYTLAVVETDDQALFSYSHGLYRIESDKLRSGRELQLKILAPDGRAVDRRLILP